MTPTFTIAMMFREVAVLGFWIWAAFLMWSSLIATAVLIYGAWTKEDYR